MKIRALVTGSDHPIGRRIQQKLIDSIGETDSNVEFVACVERTDYPELFADEEEKIWIKADLDIVEADWWREVIEDNDINTIYYLEGTENENEFLSNDLLNTRYRESDTTFIASLNELYVDEEFTQIKVIYLSTDKIHQGDEFPNELNDVMIVQPEGNTEDPNPVLNYTSLKVNSELELTSMTNLNLRIFRPFAMSAPEHDAYWPLSRLVLEAISDKDIDVYDDGLNGLAFMHIDDLVDFMTHDNLFSTDIELYSRIINAARVRNYLSEELLVKKVIQKTNSESITNLNTDINNFENIMRQPQIRNSSLIFEPRIPIEKIIEDVYYTMDPINEYVELEVGNAEYIEDNILVISGIAEPLTNIVILLGNGQTLSTECNETGSWIVHSPDPINYTDPMEGTAFATIIETGQQYDTYLFDIPAAAEI